MPIFFSFGLTYRFKSHLIYIYSRPCYHTADPGITLTPIPMAVINTGTQLPGTHVNLTSFVQHLSRLWQGAISSIISGPNHNIIDSWVWRDTQQTWPSVVHRRLPPAPPLEFCSRFYGGPPVASITITGVLDRSGWPLAVHQWTSSVGPLLADH